MTLTVKAEKGMWVVEHSGPGSEHIMDLFETTTIPTPWTTKKDLDYVLAFLRDRNPEHTVEAA